MKKKFKRIPPPKKAAAASHNRSRALHIACIILFGFAIYSGSLPGKFVWDDVDSVVDNPDIKDLSRIPAIFSGDVKDINGEAPAFYRPLESLTYMVDYFLWGDMALGYHLTSILLHCAAALTIYLLISMLFGDSLIAFLCALLFAIHPVHSEAVAYISGRADPLSLTFVLLAFALYMAIDRSGMGRWKMIGLIATYACALLSKESSLILPFLLLAYHFAFRRKIRLTPFSAIVSAAVIYLIVRGFVFHFAPVDPSSSRPLAERLPGFFVALPAYLRILIAPFNLHMEYGNAPFSPVDIRAVMGYFILTSMMLFLYFYRKRGIVTFGVAWFFAGIIPYSNIFPLNAFMAEHWLYLPSIGIFLVAAMVCANGLRSIQLKKLSTIVIVCLFGFYCALTIIQTTYWREPLTFYEKTLSYAPWSARVTSNLATIYIGEGRFEEAIKCSKKALDMSPGYGLAHANLGSAYLGLGRYVESIAALKAALERMPGNPKVHYCLGSAYVGQGEIDNAIKSFSRAIELAPSYSDAYIDLGSLFLRTGKYDNAEDIFMRLTRLLPDSFAAMANLGSAEFALGKYGEAAEAFFRALRNAPENAELHFMLGRALQLSSRDSEAIDEFKRCLEIDPEHSRAEASLQEISARK